MRGYPGEYPMPGPSGPHPNMGGPMHPGQHMPGQYPDHSMGPEVSTKQLKLPVICFVSCYLFLFLVIQSASTFNRLLCCSSVENGVWTDRWWFFICLQQQPFMGYNNMGPGGMANGHPPPPTSGNQNQPMGPADKSQVNDQQQMNGSNVPYGNMQPNMGWAFENKSLKLLLLTRVSLVRQRWQKGFYQLGKRNSWSTIQGMCTFGMNYGFASWCNVV